VYLSHSGILSKRLNGLFERSNTALCVALRGKKIISLSVTFKQKCWPISYYCRGVIELNTCIRDSARGYSNDCCDRL